MNHQRADADATPGTRSLTDAVVEAVADERGVDETALEPLYEVVEPDALERLFAPRPDGSPRTTGRVIFEMAGCEVTVRSDGKVRATPLPGGTRIADSPLSIDGPDGGSGDSAPESRG